MLNAGRVSKLRGVLQLWRDRVADIEKHIEKCRAHGQNVQYQRGQVAGLVQCIDELQAVLKIQIKRHQSPYKL